MRKFWAICSLLLSLLSPAHSQIFTGYPYQLQNGTVADASQVMANFNAIANATNANSAMNGTNTNISFLVGLANGGVAQPSITWFNYSTTGFYYDSINNCLAITFAGLEAGCWDGGGIHLLASQSNPAPTDAATVGYVNSVIGSLIIGGRLTLQATNPVMSQTIAGIGTIFYVPYHGANMVYSNGSAIFQTTLPPTGYKQDLSDTTLSPAAAVANSVYDIFFWYYTSTTFTGVTTSNQKQITTIGGINGGALALLPGAAITGPCISVNTTIVQINSPTQITISNNATCSGSGTFATNQSTNKTFAISRGPVWASITNRGYNLVRLGGYLVNAAGITNGPAAQAGIYLGTIMTDGAGPTVSWVYGSSAGGGGEGSFGVWNNYNRVMVATAVADNTVQWQYNSHVPRPAHGSTGMAVVWVCGVPEDAWTASYEVSADYGLSSGSDVADIGLGINTHATFNIPYSEASIQFGWKTHMSAHGGGYGQTGITYVQALESVPNDVLVNFYGNGQQALEWAGMM